MVQSKNKTQSIAIEFQDTKCYFGHVKAVDGVSFSVNEGEFFSMLGPSGSGKTTCLRLIAGFETPTSGKIFIHGVDAGNLPPYERDVNTVFQDYALFPHMTVGENIEYGLMIKKVPKSERKKKALEMLDMVRLPDIYDRKPSQLSGGQRQRVALARALINQPRVLLLDEPLGALDLKLREQMQIELKQLQRKIGITFIFVTHDQEEALTMSDRIAVFNHGKVEQIGTPKEVYETPKTEFVANFVGQSNIIRGEEAKSIFGKEDTYMVRPEKLKISKTQSKKSNEISIEAKVEELVFSGAYTKIEAVSTKGTRLLVMVPNASDTLTGIQRGMVVNLHWNKADVHKLNNTAA